MGLTLLVLTNFISTSHAQSRDVLVRLGIQLFDPDPKISFPALEFFVDRDKPDAAPAIILAMRFSRTGDARFVTALQNLTGETITGWNNWFLWQEAHPELGVFDGFDEVHAFVHNLIDPNFRVFLHPGIDHTIRIEEITWGGVKKDGIPALIHPALIAGDSADYLGKTDFVFGIEINGDARAYPLRILNWHEMFNDVIGGVPVALAYCTLCGSGILFETTLEGYPHPLVFGSSGFLYRSNKLMYDTYTHSLWNQFTGKPVVGPLTGSGITLKTRPVVITTWENWLKAHPQTKVLNVETGFTRDYDEGASYEAYFASPDLMFPTNVDQSKLQQKDYVFALRGALTEKSWPIKLFEGGAVINDHVGALALTLIGDASTRTVRAYQTDGQAFSKSDQDGIVSLDGARWSITEDAIISPSGLRHNRLPGHIAYWFAWSGYFGKDGEVATQQ